MPRRASSAEPACRSRRKGIRSVSKLSPSQLARKRANDREAQRAIRARTKEQIERLEHEVEELRSQRSCDRTIQELLRQNKALEVELRLLRERIPDVVSTTSSPYSAPTVIDDYLSTTPGSSAIPSPKMSPVPFDIDCAPVLEVYHRQQQQHDVGGPHCPWATALFSATASTPLTASCPAQSVPDTSETTAATAATGVPVSGYNVKLGFDDMQFIDQGNPDYELPRRNQQDIHPKYGDWA